MLHLDFLVLWLRLAYRESSKTSHFWKLSEEVIVQFCMAVITRQVVLCDSRVLLHHFQKMAFILSCRVAGALLGHT